MRKLLASSILALSLITNTFADDLKKEEAVDNTKKPEPVILQDLLCGSPKDINKRLKELNMSPVIATQSDVHSYQTVVWMNMETKDTIFVRYIDDHTGCLMGMGGVFMMKLPSKSI